MSNSDEIFKDFLTISNALEILLEMWNLYFFMGIFMEKTYLMGKLIIFIISIAIELEK